MRTIFVILVVVTMLLVSAPVMADRIDILKDTLSGQNASCPMLISNEIVKQFTDVKIPFINVEVNWQIGLKYTNSVRSFVENNSLELTNRIIF